ncbi:MAG: DUF2723 domain-containing protein [Chloroflexi bacterium]|nr:DUF2723 domain-containing protein [Chloroflexota bacterium]
MSVASARRAGLLDGQSLLQAASAGGAVPRLARADLLLALTVGGSALLLYLRTLAPTVLAFDSGEFQFAGPTLGLAHPTGYPLYLLLAWLVHWLPVGDVAYRVNLLSALAASGAVVITVFLGVSLLPGSPLARRSGASAAAALLAVASEFWSQAVIAEVYALQLLLLALLSLAVVRRWPLPVVGGLVGMSLAHHRAALLTLPVLGLYLLLDQRPGWPGLRVVGLSVLTTLLPLALYLYIPLRAEHSPYLRQVTGGGRAIVVFQNDLNGFLDAVTGRVFADKLGPAHFEERLALFVQLLGRQWNLAVLLVALVGEVLVLVRRPVVGGLLAGVFGVTVAFGLVYQIGDIEVYFIPAYWAAALAAGAFVATLVNRFRTPRMALSLGAVATLALALPPLFQHFPALDRSNDWQVRARWEEILGEPLERGAILTSDDRDDLTPLWYFTLVERRRPDLVGAFPGMVNAPEYADLGRLIDTLAGPDERIYLIKPMPGLEVKYRLEAQGSLWRVVGPAVDRDPPRRLEVRVGEELLLEGAELPALVAGEQLTVTLWWDVQQPPGRNLTTFVHLLDHQGRLVAQSDAPPGGLFYPTSRWRAGERLLDRHLLRLPSDLPAGRYSVRAGVYDERLRRLPTAQGDTVDLGAVRVLRPLSEQPAQRVEREVIGIGQLEGFTLAGSRLRLFWTAAGPTLTPLTVFLHLVDASGRLVAQADGPPAGGRLPTTSWLAGERVLDERQLPLGQLAPGRYRLVTGWYDPQTGARAPLAGGGDTIDLGELTVP